MYSIGPILMQTTLLNGNFLFLSCAFEMYILNLRFEVTGKFPSLSADMIKNLYLLLTVEE